jgi:hypothetical protein
MMTKDEASTVKTVYTRLMESEDEPWTEIDENLEFIGWLSDDALIREAKVKIKQHSKGLIRCSQDHEQQFCMAPFVLESAEIIVLLYDRTEELHAKNRYILEYYIAMSEMKMIYPA